VKLHPSRLRQIGIAKTEPGDENNQDISALVGKIDIRKLEFFSQNDPDAYSYSGGLNRTTQGFSNSSRCSRRRSRCCIRC
jgi:serine protein kinase